MTTSQNNSMKRVNEIGVATSNNSYNISGKDYRKQLMNELYPPKPNPNPKPIKKKIV